MCAISSYRSPELKYDSRRNVSGRSSIKNVLCTEEAEHFFLPRQFLTETCRKRKKVPLKFRLRMSNAMRRLISLFRTTLRCFPSKKNIYRF